MPDRKAIRVPAAQRGARITFTFDGQPLEAHEGEMLAAALMAAGVYRLRSSPARGGARGSFCLMGACQECIVRIDGRVQQSCLVTVRAALRVESVRMTEVCR